MLNFFRHFNQNVLSNFSEAEQTEKIKINYHSILHYLLFLKFFNHNFQNQFHLSWSKFSEV